MAFRRYRRHGWLLWAGWHRRKERRFISMVKKKRAGRQRPDDIAGTAQATVDTDVSADTALPSSRSHAPGKKNLLSPLPASAQRGDWTLAMLALMIFLAPAIGVPSEELLQDSLKSMVVSFGAVLAGLLFFWSRRQRHAPLHWHALMWLPLSLMVYALGSMLWSHTYLAGVEATRWFVFSLILWLGINTFTLSRRELLVEAIHWGALSASLWTALQFWFDFSYFPQGPNPASTFVNRNFFAEFVVCSMPFSAYLLAQAMRSPRIALIAATLGFNVVALMMTGTRGALSAMWLLLFLVFPLTAFLYRRQFNFSAWDKSKRWLACGVLVTTVGVLGVINTNNPRLLGEAQTSGVGTSAFGRALLRTASMSDIKGDPSLSIRFVMWSATARIIKDKPWTGVGAGAWEVMLPLYQSEGAQLETDYYVHNEFLQLLAEYGLTGWLFLLALFAYLLRAAWTTLKNRTAEGLAEAPMRAVALASLLALLIVSNIGFPWRLASTGCLFALCLGLLGASDVRLQRASLLTTIALPWKPVYSKSLFALMLACLALTSYISAQAVLTEQKIVRAVKMALAVSQSGDYNNPKWNRVKREMLSLTRQAIAINRHYRKITPMVGDELARWGDWQDAVWVWESVVSSRPYIVAIMSNIARGYAQMGDIDKALDYLNRCEKLQPKAVSVRSLKVILLSRSGREREAASLAKLYMDEGSYDFDLINAAWILSLRQHDYDMAIKSIELRNKGWPDLRVDGFLKLAAIYALQKKDERKALEYFRAAVAATSSDAEKDAVRKKIPQDLLDKL